MIDKEDLIEGEEREILSTDDAQVIAVTRGIEEPKRSRLEIHSYRELPYTRYTGDEVDELIKELVKLRRGDRLVGQMTPVEDPIEDPLAECPKCGGVSAIANKLSNPVWICSSCLHEWPAEESKEKNVVSKILQIAPPKDYDYKDGPLLFEGEEEPNPRLGTKRVMSEEYGPLEEPEKGGEWERHGQGGHQCSVCHGFSGKRTAYCPSCGASMEGK